MTDTIPNVPRELLEVIEQTWRIHYQGGPVTTDIAADAIEKGLGQLRALLSAPSPAVCKWTYNEDDCFYSTQCGSHWHYSEGGTPDEHGQLFCHACGKQVDDTRGEDCE